MTVSLFTETKVSYNGIMDFLIAESIALLVVAIVVAIVARRLRLPYTVGLVAAGMTLVFSHVDVGFSLTRDIIFLLILPPLLFEAALNLDWRELRRESAPILVFSIAGVVISTMIVFVGTMWLLHWPLAPALVFGVLIAATDPVAVIALFKDLGITGRLRLLVESESLFNDGVAAVLFALALTILAGNSVSGAEAGFLLLRTAGGGVVVGIAVALIALLAAGRTSDHLVETAVTVVAAYGAFLLAEHLHFSGVLATVSAGLLFGALGLQTRSAHLGLSEEGRDFVMAFWEFWAFLANSVVFLLIGVNVSHTHLSELGYGALAIIILLVLLGRALTVYPLSWAFHRSVWAISLKKQHVLFWAGLRGALALALALSLPDSLPMRDSVIVAAFGVVAFSVLVQGLTMSGLLRLLRVD